MAGSIWATWRGRGRPDTDQQPERARTRVLAVAPVSSSIATVATDSTTGSRPNGSTGSRHDARRRQATAWAHRSRIGPIRGGLNWQADTLGGVRFGLAVHVAGEDEPVPVDSPAARRLVGQKLLGDAQAQLDRLPLHDSQFTTLLASNLLTAGEVHLHGTQTELGRGRRAEQWHPMSMFQVRPLPGGEMQIRDPDTGEWRYLRADEAFVRLHVPDPAFPWLPDGPLLALEEECQQVIMAMLELRALSLSRITANGYILIPDTLSLLRHTVEDSGAYDVSVQDEEFMAEFAAVGLAPITDPGSPGAALPAVIRGAPEDLKEVRHLHVERADAPQVLERYWAFLRIVFETLDLPVEQLDGIGSMKYWNGLVVTADRWRSYVEPKARLIADRLAAEFIRAPLISELRHDPAAVALLRVVAHGDHLLVNPNRAADAQEAFDRFAIGHAALRAATAFSDADAPTEDELALMLAAKNGGDVAAATELLQPLLRGRGQPPATPPAPGDGGQPAPVPDDDDTGTPSGPGGLAGQRRVFATVDPDEQLTRLADLDRNLRSRLVVAADATVTRAVEQAAARLRSQARTDPELRTRLVGLPVTEVGYRVGRERCAQLGVDVRGLLDRAWERLRASFEEWVLAAVADAGRLIARLLDTDRTTTIDRLTVTIRSRITLAWEPMQFALEDLADAALFDPATPPGGIGEPHYGRVPPGIVRAALATAGGWADPSFGGVAVSQAATDLFIAAGWITTGYLWRYGNTQTGRWFEPHLDRDGVVFDSRQTEDLRADPQYTSLVGAFYHPGDHPGCDCDWVTLWRPR